MTDIQLPAGPPRRREEMGGPGQPAREPGIGDSDLATLAGVAAVVFPLVYFASSSWRWPRGISRPAAWH